MKSLLLGLLVGIADLIPGVSGGTIAYISGEYETLITQLKQTLKKPWKITPFIALFFAGILISVFSFATLITHLLETYPTQLQLIFTLLLIAIAVYLVLRTKIELAYALLGCGIVLVSTHLTAHLTHPAFTFIAVVFAASAMLLPGISGSALLYALGQYSTVLGAIATLNVLLLGLIGGAVLTGWYITTTILDKYMHHAHLHSLLVGFIIGAIPALLL